MFARRIWGIGMCIFPRNTSSSMFDLDDIYVYAARVWERVHPILPMLVSLKKHGPLAGILTFATWDDM